MSNFEVCGDDVHDFYIQNSLIVIRHFFNSFHKNVNSIQNLNKKYTPSVLCPFFAP
jgi:archaellum biogenesis protein FlaJ (TadC family)